MHFRDKLYLSQYFKHFEASPCETVRVINLFTKFSQNTKTSNIYVTPYL